MATFTKAGTYSFQVTIRDAGNLSVTSTVSVTVAQTLTRLGVAPGIASVARGATQLFTATALDQFGRRWSRSRPVSWAVSGGGTITPAGLFTAGNVIGGPLP